jgi:hypothetical protein
MSRFARRLKLLAAALGAAVTFTGAVAGGATPASAATANQFSGEACPVTVTPYILPGVLGTVTDALNQCVELPTTGGAEQGGFLSLSDVMPTPVTAGPVSVNSLDLFAGHVQGHGSESHTHSSAAALSLTVAGTPIAAEFLMSNSNANCSGVSGTSEIADLTIGTQHFAVGGAPNQVILDEPGLITVIANAQKDSSSGNHKELDVTALRIIVPDVAQVDIATSHADVTCNGGPTCPTGTGEFLTGGGWFTGYALSKGIVVNDSTKRQFADAAGYKNKGIWGHLEYQDKAAGVKMKGDPSWYGLSGVSAPMLADPAGLVHQVLHDLFGIELGLDPATTRYIIGTLDNGGYYLIRTADNGEPGHGSDQFTILFLTTDVLGKLVRTPGLYAATSESPVASESGIDGGNVQLHQPQCPTTGGGGGTL